MKEPKFFLKIIIINYILLVANSGAAESSEPSETSDLHDPLVYYGMAGCGPGSIIFKKNNRLSQIAAWFVNVVSLRDSSLSFYVSSETSNCPSGDAIYDDKKYKSAAKRQILLDYIAVNFDNLRKDSARGTGFFLGGLAMSFGCGDDAVAKIFFKISQANFEAIYGNAKGNNPDEVIDRYVNFIKSDDVLSARCRYT